jgi:hypothetical protein
MIRFKEHSMSLIASKRLTTGELEYRWASGVPQVYDVALALVNRGDELIHIAPNKDEYPVTVSDIKLAKAERDHFARMGVRYESLPALDH